MKPRFYWRSFVFNGSIVREHHPFDPDAFIVSRIAALELINRWNAAGSQFHYWLDADDTIGPKE